MNKLWICVFAFGVVFIPVTSAVEPSQRPTVGQTRLLPLTEKTKSSFAWVPPGDSWLGGGKDKEGQNPFSLAHGLWCGQYEVTQEEWEAVMGNNPSYYKDKPKHPVENVSWNDVQEFLKKVNATNKRSGLLYRLPTEQEWEYILRGGVITKIQSKYSFYFARGKMDLAADVGNDLSSLQANFAGKYPAGIAKQGPTLQSTSPVGSYLPNPLGIYDMHGNVWEWTSSQEGSLRVRRGGGWSSNGGHCSATNRNRVGSDYRQTSQGFRLLAVSLEK